MHVDGWGEDGGCEDDLNTPYDDCLRDQYRSCYNSYDGIKYCNSAPHPAWCDDEGRWRGDCSITMNNINYCYVPYSMHKDAFAVPINEKEHADKDKLSETITVCRNSWSSDFLTGVGAGDPQKKRGCITVKYDTDSMRGYSKDGFGANYCAENQGQFKDGVEAACFWGGAIGGLVVSMAAGPGGGLVAAVIIPVSMGSIGVACEKIANMEGNWPHSQYD